MVTNRTICYIKKERKVMDTKGTEVFQTYSFERLSIHLNINQLKTLKSLLNVLAERDEISVDHVRLTTIQC